MRRLLPHNSGRLLERIAASPTPLPAARTIHGVRQRTPESIAISLNLDLARGMAAVLPTFHHDCRHAAWRPRQCAQPMKHLEPKFLDLKFLDFKYLESEMSDIEKGTGDYVI
jgi:hypothetical protein